MIADPTRYIFSLKAPGKNTLTQRIWKKRRSLPFCTRWLPKFSPQKSHTALVKILEKDRNVISYPVLVDQDQGIISQFEHTVLVGRNGCTILTHPN